MGLSWNDTFIEILNVSYFHFTPRGAACLGGWPLPRLWVAGLAGSPVAGSVQVCQRPNSGIRRGLG
jgi:hypothetical protein